MFDILFFLDVNFSTNQKKKTWLEDDQSATLWNLFCVSESKQTHFCYHCFVFI